mmetsp:Transcript_12007/g.19003  ORF Transcript_12007/g.19003 Transcript_12007/m.19003 type:complete len:424 (+) Transcript_12007:67-1338(+)
MLVSAQYDVLVLGATGFTGQLAAAYLSRQYPESSNVKWAIAGRSEAKLNELCKTLDGKINTVICDVMDPAAVERAVLTTKVVANFAGTPFADKAAAVVESCSKHGRHYVDITGEICLHKASYDSCHDTCKRTGAIILHGCGYDSVPSDIGSFMAAEAMLKEFGCKCKTITCFSGKSKGSLSGGTLATGLIMASSKAKTYPGFVEAAKLGMCYPLDPPGGKRGKDTNNHGGAPLHYNKVAQTWCAPFIMADINAPVVRKSNALFNYRYGDQMRYYETSAMPNLASALALVSGLFVGVACIAIPPFRWVLFKMGLLPKPGEGPSVDLQNTGYFHTFVVAEGETDGAVTTAHIRSGDAGDPGYKATARMCIESALCLALDRDSCSKEGGVLTTATGLGEVLIARLNKSGMELTVEKGPPSRKIRIE